MVATSPPALSRTPTLHRGGLNRKWPTSGRGGYITRALEGVPNASQRGTTSEVAHVWARWLHYPYRPGGPQPRGTKSELAHKRAELGLSYPLRSP